MTMAGMIETHTSIENIANDLERRIFDRLGLIIASSQASQFRKDVRKIIQKAIEIWQFAQQDKCKISVEIFPDLKDKSGWLQMRTKKLEGLGLESVVKVSSASGDLLTFPKIVRSDAAMNSNGVNGINGTQNHGGNGSLKPSVAVLHPGYALFGSSGIFDVGQQEFNDLQQRIEDRKSKAVLECYQDTSTEHLSLNE
jgi:hypothetical protein